MENKSHAMAAGLFVVTLVTMLMGLALWLTRDQHEYTRYELSTTDAISGLQVQATVRYKGVAVGKVTDIGFDDQQSGNVLIRIDVDADAPVSPTRTYAQLGYQGVTGIAHIQLDDVNEPIVAQPPGNSGLPRLQMKSSPLSVLADQGMLILSKVNDATERINQLLGEDNQQRIGTLLDSLTMATNRIGEVAHTANATLRQHINPAVDQLPAVAQDARQTLQSIANASQQIGELTAQLQAPGGTLEQLQVGTQSMARAAERFDRATLPAVHQATAEVASAARQLGRTVSGIGDNPQALLYGDGAIRPGPGEPGFVPPALIHP